MKGDWNRRATENARYYIATSVEDDERAFAESGRRDVGYLFDGLEHLLHPTAVVLDIGCGIGRMDEFVAPRVGRLIGIDVSGEMVRRASQRLAHLGNASFVEGDGQSLHPVGGSSIDLVFSHIVFQHMPRATTVRYFEDVFRVLRRQGRFVFQMPEASADTPADPPLHDTFEMRFYGERELRDRLSTIGFDVVEFRRYPAGDDTLRFHQMRVHAVKP